LGVSPELFIKKKCSGKMPKPRLDTKPLFVLFVLFVASWLNSL
jgi:hypothetical protein